jgi:hypothetical protein
VAAREGDGGERRDGWHRRVEGRETWAAPCTPPPAGRVGSSVPLVRCREIENIQGVERASRREGREALMA